MDAAKGGCCRDLVGSHRKVVQKPQRGEVVVKPNTARSGGLAIEKWSKSHREGRPNTAGGSVRRARCFHRKVVQNPHCVYYSESWTLTAELEKRTQAFEMRCYRRLLNISYKDHVTNEEVRRKIQAAIGEYDELLTLVKKRKLRWFGHVSRSSGLAKTILQGTVKGKRKGG